MSTARSATSTARVDVIAGRAAHITMLPTGIPSNTYGASSLWGSMKDSAAMGYVAEGWACSHGGGRDREEASCWGRAPWKLLPLLLCTRIEKMGRGDEHLAGRPSKHKEGDREGLLFPVSVSMGSICAGLGNLSRGRPIAIHGAGC